jgi:hypothetical protein
MGKLKLPPGMQEIFFFAASRDDADSVDNFLKGSIK